MLLRIGENSLEDAVKKYRVTIRAVADHFFIFLFHCSISHDRGFCYRK